MNNNQLLYICIMIILSLPLLLCLIEAIIISLIIDIAISVFCRWCRKKKRKKNLCEDVIVIFVL